MGLRFRKGISVGKYFKINLSKSGVGYSFGVNGAHISRTAKGRIRRTISIPGTGLSYIKERKKTSSSNNTKTIPSQTTELSEQISFNELPSAKLSDIAYSILIKRIIYTVLLGFTIGCLIAFFINLVYLDKLPDYLPIIFAIGIVFFSLATAIFKAVGRVVLDYNENDNDKYDYSSQNKFIKISKSNIIWLVLSVKKTNNVKTNFSAQASLSRAKCVVKHKSVFPIKTNAQVICFRCKKPKETLLFLPDQLIMIKGFKVNSFEYTSLTMESGEVQFVESEKLPNDATVLNYVWQKTNKNGTIDKRYKDNRQLPVCKYGGMAIENHNGLELFIMFSACDILK